MRLRNVTLSEFRASVERVNVNYGGNLHVHDDAHETGSRTITTVGRLDVLDSRAHGARTSWSGRHMKAACWHAFRDVVRDILENNEDAVITTSMARYDADTFEDTYPSTAYTNVGSMVQPAYMTDLCVGDCAGDTE
jgi:hypothetical protein